MCEAGDVDALRAEVANLRREVEASRAVDRAIYAALIELGNLPFDMAERFRGNAPRGFVPADVEALSNRTAKLDAAIGALYGLLWDENGRPR